MLSLAILTAGVALGSQAPTKPAEAPIATVEGWPIFDNRGTCATTQSYEGGAHIFLSYDFARSRATIVLDHSAWQSVEQGREYQVKTEFSNGSSYGPGRAVGKVPPEGSVTDPGLIMSYPADLLEDFAHSVAVRFTMGGTLLATLDLDGTRAAVARLRQCAIDSNRRHPADPFADLPAGGQSGGGSRGSVGTVAARLLGGGISDADYPASAFRAGAQGTTRMSIQVGSNGRVTGCSVTGSSGNSALDSTACSLVQRRYRYQPAVRDGVPVASTVSSSVRWVLPKDSAATPEISNAAQDQGAGSPSATVPHPFRPLSTPGAQHPSRQWVQIAIAPNFAGFPRELDRIRRAAPELLRGRAAHTAATGGSERLLIGPFASTAEARAFVDKLREADFAASAWVSPAGQAVVPLRGD